MQARLYRPQGGETFGQVRERVAHWLRDIGSREPGCVVAVTHAGALHAFVDILVPGIADRPGFRFLPGSITRVDVSQTVARIVTLDDVEHLVGIV
jgi:broad specificity phosphatase PhoE